MSKIDLTGITFKYILTITEFTASLWKLSMDFEFIMWKKWKISQELGPQTYIRKHPACLDIRRIDLSHAICYNAFHKKGSSNLRPLSGYAIIRGRRGEHIHWICCRSTSLWHTDFLMPVNGVKKKEAESITYLWSYYWFYLKFWMKYQIHRISFE